MNKDMVMSRCLLGTTSGAPLAETGFCFSPRKSSASIPLDFVDHSWVPLNVACRSFFFGHCMQEDCPHVHADTFAAAEAVYAGYRQLYMSIQEYFRNIL